ncbi:MAG TPA: amidohydrolase family protein [Candidatus Binatia bacterium]|jgi:predicted TIM-barrel fold metal-dependent hydrolase|nr:amidohydrolase family protein [Candidatus Binatia bacterium]
MAQNHRGLVVDADGHVLEPADTWVKYVEPQYRDRAIRIERDANGYEFLAIDNKPLQVLYGQLGVLGGIEMDAEELMTPGKKTYADGCPPGSYDPKARLQVMDQEGIDIALLYPTIGICWEGAVHDAKLATAYTRAYNRWLVDFCRENPQRLFPVAHISLLDPEGAVEETLRARKDGCVGVYLSPDIEARDGKHFDDPAFVRFWETVQDLEMPVGFHVVVRDRPFFREWLFRRGTPDGLFGFAFLAIDVIAAFTQMLSAGMLEKYPRLKCSVLEAGANWIAAWLDRLDHKYRVMKSRTPIHMKPSEYFYRQCLISTDPDESTTAEIVKHIGADYFIWASDYPHVDASFGVVAELKERLAPLPEADRRKVLGGNAVRFYNLGV